MIALKSMAQITMAAKVVEASFALYRTRLRCVNMNPVTVPGAAALADAQRAFDKIVREAIQEIPHP
jgi:hypothetical protein